MRLYKPQIVQGAGRIDRIRLMLLYTCSICFWVTWRDSQYLNKSLNLVPPQETMLLRRPRAGRTRKRYNHKFYISNYPLVITTNKKKIKFFNLIFFYFKICKSFTKNHNKLSGLHIKKSIYFAFKSVPASIFFKVF